MQTLGERLRAALAYWGKGHRQFARQMEATGVRGHAYRSLVNYLNDATTPSVAWLREAAHILDISEPWLGSGSGQMLPIEEHVPRSRASKLLEIMAEALEQAAPGLGETAHPLVLGHLLAAVDRFGQAYHHTPDEVPLEEMRDAARRLLVPLGFILLATRQIAAPLQGHDSERTRIAITSYLDAVALLIPSREAVSDDVRDAVQDQMRVGAWAFDKVNEILSDLPEKIDSE